MQVPHLHELPLQGLQLGLLLSSTLFVLRCLCLSCFKLGTEPIQLALQCSCLLLCCLRLRFSGPLRCLHDSLCLSESDLHIGHTRVNEYMLAAGTVHVASQVSCYGAQR